MVDLLIRVDATPSMGMGHLMRCLAFAEHCQKQSIETLFVCQPLMAEAKHRLAQKGFLIEELNSEFASQEEAMQLLTLAHKSHIKTIVFDGYHFTEDYFNQFKNVTYQLGMIDDFALAPSFFDWVINFQPWAQSLSYQTKNKLLGLEYFLLRKEFWPYLGKMTTQKKHILITMGGTDPHQQTQRLVGILDQLSLDVDICVIMGTTHPAVEEAILNYNNPQRISLHVNPKDMPSLMAEAIFAITAGGGTCWELAAMGVPAIVITQAENQQRVVEFVEKYQTGINLGYYSDVSDQLIKESISTLMVNDPLKKAMQTAGLELNIGSKISTVADFIKEQCHA
ncbi:MAG: UDP-2,4-diacetamido-2,4,6-trideoxy-beta-L-altropyranose hydrolase [Candidatus Berkiella sp.]